MKSYQSSGNAFLLNIRESVLLPGSMSEMHFFTDRYFFIHSDRVILAMKDYLVGGHSRGRFRRNTR